MWIACLLCRYEPPIETTEDLASRNIIWAGNHIAWIWSIKEDDNPDLQIITRNFRCLSNELMNEIGQKSSELAFGIERLQGGEVQAGRWLWTAAHGTDIARRVGFLNTIPVWNLFFFLIRENKRKETWKCLLSFVARVEKYAAYIFHVFSLRNCASHHTLISLLQMQIYCHTTKSFLISSLLRTVFLKCTYLDLNLA